MKHFDRSASGKAGPSRAVDEARMKILEMLDAGKINAEQAARLLEAIEPTATTPPPPSWTSQETETEGAQFDEQGRLVRVFPTEGLKGVQVKSTNGRISVTEHDKPEIEIVAQLKKAGNTPPHVSFAIDDGVLVIRAISGNARHGVPFSFFSINQGRAPQLDFDIRMPKTLTVRLGNVNGSIHVRGMANRTKAGTTNGSIHCESIRGTLKATTTNGSIQAHNLETTETKLGSVNGSAMAAFISCPSGECSVKTVNGSVSVYLPENPSVTVDAGTVSGSVKADFPIESSTSSRRRLQGRLGSGALALTLKTVNGAIRLRKLADLEPAPTDESDDDLDNDDAGFGFGFGGMGVAVDGDAIKKHVHEAVTAAQEQAREAHRQVAESMREIRRADEDDDD